MATLEHDVSELIAAGMVTLNAKFIGVEDEKLVPRVIDLWVFFWDQVLPYVEGVSCMQSFFLLFGNLINSRSSYRSKQARYSHLSIAIPNLIARLPPTVKIP
jgi:hypothetical protein